jgi:hypothetical protein
MQLERSTLVRLISFLLGVAWAFVMLGITFTFLSYFKVSIIDSLLFSFLGSLPGLFFVVVLEYILVGLQRFEEIKKQTNLLEEIVDKNRRDDLLRD